MGVLARSRRPVGELFRSRNAELGIVACSDATASTLNRLSSIGLPINAVVTGTPASILAPETHTLLAHSRLIFS